MYLTITVNKAQIKAGHTENVESIMLSVPGTFENLSSTNEFKVSSSSLQAIRNCFKALFSHVEK